MPIVIKQSRGNTNAGSQRAINSSMRLPCAIRVGYNPNSMAIHPVINAMTSHETHPIGSSQLARIRSA